jgi:hypothetical protein
MNDIIFKGLPVIASEKIPKISKTVRIKRWKRLNRPDKIKRIEKQEIPVWQWTGPLGNKSILIHPDNLFIFKESTCNPNS